MKVFLAFASLATVACIAQGLVTKEYAAKIKAAGLKCKNELKLDDESLKKMRNEHKAPETEEEKCMAACCAKEMGYIHDGKLDLAVILETNKFKWEDAANVEKANVVSKTCVKEVGTQENVCEIAGKMIACILREAKAQGLPAPEFSIE